MKLTKDEAAILAKALDMAMYDMKYSEEDFFDVMQKLQQRLEEYSDDKRRKMDTWSDLVKRQVEQMT